MPHWHLPPKRTNRCFHCRRRSCKVEGSKTSQLSKTHGKVHQLVVTESLDKILEIYNDVSTESRDLDGVRSSSPIQNLQFLHRNLGLHPGPRIHVMLITYVLTTFRTNVGQTPLLIARLVHINVSSQDAKPFQFWKLASHVPNIPNQCRIEET